MIGIYVKNLDGLTSFSEFLSGNTIVFVIIGLQFAIVAVVAYNMIVLKRRGTEDSAVETAADESGKDEEITS